LSTAILYPFLLLSILATCFAPLIMVILCDVSVYKLWIFRTENNELCYVPILRKPTCTKNCATASPLSTSKQRVMYQKILHVATDHQKATQDLTPIIKYNLATKNLSEVCYRLFKVFLRVSYLPKWPS
jgi:hypothetical protein